MSDSWHPDYPDGCVKCGNKDKKYMAKGLCTTCYQRKHQSPNDKRILNKEDIEKVKRNLTNSRDIALFHLIYTQGLRASEAVTLRKEKNKTKVCRCSYCRGEIKGYIDNKSLILWGKGRKVDHTPERIPLHPGAKQALEVHANSHQGKYLFPPERSDSTKRHITRQALHKIVRRWAAKNDIDRPEEVTVHCFRRSVISHLVNSGYNRAAVQAFVRHKHSQTTDQYVMTGEDAIREAFEWE